MITIADESQYGRLAEIWERAVTDTHDFLQREDLYYFKSKLAGYFEAVDLYKSEEEGKVNGFVGVLDNKIEMLFVEQRGKGTGSRLLSFALNELECTKVDVNEQNIRAVDFYIRHGFRITGRSETDDEGRPYPIIHMSIGNK